MTSKAELIKTWPRLRKKCQKAYDREFVHSLKRKAKKPKQTELLPTAEQRSEG